MQLIQDTEGEGSTLKISAVFPSLNSKMSANKSPYLLLAFCSLLFGLIAGVAVYYFCDELISDTLPKYFLSFSTEFNYKSKPEILSGLAVYNLIYFFALLVLSTSALGAPIILFISFIKSAGLTLVVSHIYAVYALKGIEYCLLVFLPGKAVLLFAMLLYTQLCCKTSTKIASVIRGNYSDDKNIKPYIARVIIVILLFMFSTLMDFLTIISFSSLFAFG